MEDANEIRIDKFLWSVRLYKTRTLATDACKKGWVMVNKSNVKPSRTLKIGEIIFVKTDFIFRQFKVLQPLHNRVGAKLVENYIVEVTPDEDLLKLKTIKELDPFGKVQRETGTGRPTKKERRDLEDYFD